MSHDVFISFSNHDKPTADAVCHGLEEAGIRCWMAPRDVPAGSSWKRSIVEAIRQAKVMVLVFSGEANGSAQVQREVDIAFEAGHPILPFRIENVEMNDELYYCIAARHWLDALTPPLHVHIQKLVAAVEGLIGGPREAGIRDRESAQPAPRDSVIRHQGEVKASEQAIAAPMAVIDTPPTVKTKHNERPKRRPKKLTLWVVGIYIAIVVVAILVWGGNVNSSRAEELTRQAERAFEAKEFDEAFPLFLSAANDGNAEAQAYLGLSYLEGYGTPKDSVTGLEWMRKSAAKGNPRGQFYMAIMYAFGNAGQKDPREALRLARASAASGFAEAQYYLGLALTDSAAAREYIGTSADPEEGFELMHQAAQNGYAEAQQALATAYLEGDFVRADTAESVRWLRLAAERGEAYPKYKLAEMYELGRGIPVDMGEATLWYRRSAEQGYQAAQYKLGVIHNNSNDAVRFDPAEAARWFRAAAEEGHAEAQVALGNLYYSGTGVALRDLAEAAKWYRLAAEQGNGLGQFYLANMYRNGWGVETMLSEAARWYRAAADNGIADAQNSLGYAYLQGEGVAREYAEALKWFRQASTQGHGTARHNIGYMYEYGLGVAPNLSEAIRWYRLGALKDVKHSQDALKRLGVQ